MMARPPGARGAWRVPYCGEILPCVWERWLAKDGKSYCDERSDPTKPEFSSYFAALKKGKALLFDAPDYTAQTWKRGQMLALLHVANVKQNGFTLTFDVLRHEDIRR